MVESRRFYAQGEVIFREGEFSDAVYIIESGSVAIIKAESQDRSVILATLEPSEILGEMGVLCDMPRNATAQAMEDSWLEVIPQRDFTSWVLRDSATALRVMQTLAIRLNDADSIIAKQRAAPQEVSELDLREMNKILSRNLEKIEKQRSRLETQVSRDPLTALFNRRYLDERFDRILGRAKRYNFPVSLAIIDLDHFKVINDSHGHRAGDEVLKALAALLQATSRDDDIPCRYGGEEFVVLLPGMQLDIARKRAEQWREAFGKLPIRAGVAEIRATMSVGLACFPDHATSAEALIDAADKALYQAKSAGRNRVMLAERG